MSDSITDYPGKGNPAVEAALKSGEWKTKLDKSTNKVFFYNTKDKKTTWDLAKELAKSGGGGATAATDSSSASGGGKKTFGGKKETTTPATSNTDEKKEEPAFQETSPVQQQQQQAPQQQQQQQQQPANFFQQQMSTMQQQQSASSSSAAPYNGVQLSDPIQRLLEHNKKLVTDVSSHEAESIKAGMSTFETRLDLLVHSNNVLAVQLDRRNQEALAMQRALTEAHDTIHKLRNENKNLEDMRSLSYAHGSLGAGGANSGMSGDEAKRSVGVALETVGRTVVHLQEQNRSLAATIAQLTSQLMQNVQASNVSKGVESVQDQPHEWWKNSKGYSVAALTSRFLDSPARNALCAKCMMRVSDFRDSLLKEVPMTQAQKEAQERKEREEQQYGVGGGAAAASSSSSSSPYRGGGGSGATPTVMGRAQPSYVPVNAFRPSASAAAGPGGAAPRQGSPPGSYSTPKAAGGGGGVFSGYNR